MSAYCRKCPVCGKPGYGVKYAIRDGPVDPDNPPQYFELVIHHGIKNQTKTRIARALGRNYKCNTKIKIPADPYEYYLSWRASPKSPPNISF